MSIKVPAVCLIFNNLKSEVWNSCIQWFLIKHVQSIGVHHSVLPISFPGLLILNNDIRKKMQLIMKCRIRTMTKKTIIFLISMSDTNLV